VFDLPGLQQRREQRSFAQWDEFVAPELVALSEVIVRQLIDRLLELGPMPTREQVQGEVTRCVWQFNGLNRAWKHPWICTIEREDICLALERLAGLCGFDAAEDWAGERDW
jgi:hypothetical protein